MGFPFGLPLKKKNKKHLAVGHGTKDQSHAVSGLQFDPQSSRPVLGYEIADAFPPNIEVLLGAGGTGPIPSTLRVRSQTKGPILVGHPRVYPS